MNATATLPGLPTTRFFASSVHEEALARLDYLVAEKLRLGVLVGARGSGKSLMLDLAARQWQRANQAVARLDGTALEAADALHALAVDWHNPVPLDASRARQWQAICDALRTHQAEQRASVLLVDNAGDAQYEVLDLLSRLAHAGDALQPALTIILATDAARLSHLGAALLCRAELRIELTPLDQAETLGYLEAQLHDGAPSAPPLEPAAGVRLHQLTDGLPRRLNQLARLVALAAQAEGLPAIDVATVDAVYRELSVPTVARR